VSNSSDKPDTKREYPAVYEKIVPIALGIIGLAIVVLVIIAIIVALGFFPGS
jgi:hypothetical protein